MRYNNTNILSKPKRYYATTAYPTFEPRETDIYIIAREGDRLDTLAHQYYNNVNMWFVIARANNIGKGTVQITPGIRVRIPFPLTEFEVEQAFIQVTP